jgi:hypothetical protein
MSPQCGTFKEAKRVRLQGPDHPQLELGENEKAAEISERPNGL